MNGTIFYTIYVLTTLIAFLAFPAVFILTDSTLELNQLFFYFLGLSLWVIYTLFAYHHHKGAMNIYIFSYSLVIGIITASLSSLTTLSWAQPSDGQLILQMTFPFWSMMYFLLYLFFEGLENDNVPHLRLSVVTVLFTTEVLLRLGLMTNILDRNSGLDCQESLVFLADFCYNVLALIIFIFGAWIFYYAYLRESKLNESTAHFVSLMVVIVSFVLSLLKVTTGYFQLELPGLVGWELISLINLVGIVGFCVSYLANMDHYYKLTSPIYSLTFFENESGISLRLARSTRTNYQHKTSESLIPGMMVAISALVQEITSSEDNQLEVLGTSGRALVFRSLESISLVCVTDKPSRYMKQSMDRALVLFHEKFKSHIPVQHPTKRTTYEDITDILAKAFPFEEFV